MTSLRSGILAGAAVLALLAGCGDDPPSAPTPGNTVTLTGTVREVDRAVPTPIIQVRVNVVDGVNAGRVTMSDSQGNYTLAGLSPGAFTLQFARDGYIELRRPMTLTQDTTLDVTLDRSGPPTYTLSGTITTPWNEPLDDTGVEATAGGRVVGGGTTNRSGAYSIPTLPPQDYLVRVRKFGYSTPDVTIAIAANVRHDFVMDRGRTTIRGTVTEAQPCSAPIDEARVEVVDGPDAGSFVHTGRAGDFILSNVRWGSFRLRASKGGHTASEVAITIPSPGGPGSSFTEHFRLVRPGCPG